MKEPLSTISNLAYAVAGFAAYSAGAPAYVAAAFVALALGSGWYHGLGSRRGQSADEIAMYAVVLALLAYGFDSLAIRIGIGLVFVGFAVFHRKIDSFVALPAIGASILVLIGLSHTALVAIGLGAVFVAAFALRAVGTILDGPARPIVPDALHTVWHLVTAYGLYLAFTLL